MRNEPEGIRRYMHFGTGNYNDKTAKLYTDLSLFTCRADLGADVTQLFNCADRLLESRRLRAAAGRADRSAAPDSCT